MARIKDRTYVLNRSSKPNQPARNRPVSPITWGLCLHATRPTPKTDKPALQAAQRPLAQTVENAPVRLSPYDSTFASLELVTSSTTSLQASEHAILHLKRPFSGKSSYKSLSTHHEFLCITPSLCCCERFPTRSYPSPLFAIATRPMSALPFPPPGLLLLESPLSRTPCVADRTPSRTASRRVCTTLTPKVNLSDQGRLSCRSLHYAGAALVVHVVLKGVKVETQADCTMLTQALAFVPLRTTKRVIRGPQNTFPLSPLAHMKEGA